MIYLTGAAGFVGSNIARRLLKEGLMVHCIDDLSFGDERNLIKGVLFEKIDFKDLKHGFKDSDILIHCATANIIYGMSHPIETFKVNALDTIELFKRFPGKIIYTSTSSVYGNAKEYPTKETADIKCSNAYDTSKRVAEQFLQQRGNYTTLRLTNVYGPNQRATNPYCGVLGKLLYCKITGRPFIVSGTGIDTRDYTYVDDVTEAVSRALQKGSLNTEVNIGTGREMSVIGLYEAVDKLPGDPLKVEFGFTRKIDGINRRCLDNGLAKKLLDWKPFFDLEKGIKLTYEWYKGQ